MRDRVTCRLKEHEPLHHGVSECRVSNKWCMDDVMSKNPSHGSLDAGTIASSSPGAVLLIGQGASGAALEPSCSAPKAIR